LSERRKSLLQSAREGARRPGTTTVLIGSAASGFGAYLFQVIGTRTLGDEAFAPIGVLWTIHYLVLTIALVSVEAHVTRTITLHADHPAHVRRAIVAMGVWAVGVAGAVGAATALWRRPLFHSAAWDFPAVAVATVLGYGAFVLIRGWLAGSYRFRQYGMATALESLARLGALIPVAVVAASTRSVAWTLTLAPWSVVAWWTVIRRRTYRGPTRPADPPGLPRLKPSSAARYLAFTATANAASQTLLAAGPLVLLPLGAGPAEVSVFFVTVTAARVPLVFAFGGLLSRVLPPLARAARAGEHDRLRRLAAAVTVAAGAVAAAGAAGGAWIGPDVIALFFGEAFRPPGWFAALTAAGVVGATAALGLNQLLIAMGAEHRLVVPWLAALAAGALTIVATSGSASFRVILGFVVGEATALVALAMAVLMFRPGPSQVDPTAEPLPPPLGVGE
jgi:O-antigen/teichoic acid export membrane protein